ncbi:hypothetical protein ACH4FX_08225 [Streptomyces sp. NPDC018019]
MTTIPATLHQALADLIGTDHGPVVPARPTVVRSVPWAAFQASCSASS